MNREPAGGVVIGRFMPPHAGHRYLIEFAQNYVNQLGGDLTIFVCTLRSEPIAGELRHRWMRELFPSAHVIHVTEEIPEASRSSEGAQDLWAESIRTHLVRPPAYVFASEAYGADFAAALGAQFVPVDPHRNLFPVSAGMIRADPFTHWRYIPSVVRPYFVRRISVVADGLDLAERLAAAFQTVCATDYLAYRRTLPLPAPTISRPADLLAASAASERALLREANRVLFITADLLRSILAHNDGPTRDNLVSGAMDPLLDIHRPHLVLIAGKADVRYVEEATRRRWPMRELDPGSANLETEAASIVRTTLEPDWNGGAPEE